MRILDRYLFREIALHFIAITGVLFAINTSFLFAKKLLQAADNQFSQSVVWGLLGLASLQNLAQLVPISLFLAIMLALGRLYHDSEMAAVQACGYGVRQWCRPVFVLTALVAALLTWLAFWIAPQAMVRTQEITLQAMREARFASLEPKRFSNAAGGEYVFYAERIEAGVLYNVFVQRRVGEQVEVMVADRAEQRGVGEAQQTFVLYDGEHYEGVPGGGKFIVTRFGEWGIPWTLPTLPAGAARIDSQPTVALLQSNQLADWVELQSRASSPLMTLLLAIMAVPLARLRPRQGRYANVGVGLLVFFIYLLTINTASVWMAQGTLPSALGIWWVHLLALCFGMWLLLRQDPPMWWLRLAAASASRGSR